MKSKYTEAGVDIDKGNQIVKDIKGMVRSTFSPAVLADIGLFGGLYDITGLGEGENVLVASIDGVGTKLHLAAQLNRFRGVGHDIVAHCCDDIVVQGARPLFFLDYVAAADLTVEGVTEIVAGITEECRTNNCALLGGETAEMPGFYPENEYDLAGYCTGIVDKDKIIDNTLMKPGDVIIELPSSGVHSNGFSLVRKVFDVENPESKVREPLEELGGKSILETLLTPTKIYVKPVLKLLERVHVRGISHITGGGFYENIPRSIPEGLCAEIDGSSIKILPIFRLIQERGGITERDMFNTFNMGVGMSVTVPADEAEEALSVLNRCGVDAYVIGKIAAADGSGERIRIC